MPTSSDHTSHSPHFGGWQMAGLTAVVAAFLLGLAWLVPLETRNAGGELREMTAFEVWSEMLDNIPDDAPFFLTSSVLAVLSVLAVVGSAWIIVAIARLPR